MFLNVRWALISTWGPSPLEKLPPLSKKLPHDLGFRPPYLDKPIKKPEIKIDSNRSQSFK